MKRKKRSRGWRRGNLTRGRCNRAGAARSRQGPQNAGEETGAVGLPTPHGIHRKGGYGMFSEILRSLRKAKATYEAGERSADKLKAVTRAELEGEPLAKVDYVDLYTYPALQAADTVTEPCLLAIAVYIGKTRLIDNVILE